MVRDCHAPCNLSVQPYFLLAVVDLVEALPNLSWETKRLLKP